MTRIPLALTTDRPDAVLDRIRTTEGDTSDRLTSGLRFQLHDAADRERRRQEAEARADRALAVIVIGSVAIGIALAALITALWTVQIETALFPPRVIY